MGEIPEASSLAERFWRIHPREIQDMGITRQQFYEHEIARAILAERQRCADLADKEAAGYKENGFPQAALGCITTRKAILN